MNKAKQKVKKTCAGGLHTKKKLKSQGIMGTF
jgi:hypothetical protein